MARNQWRKKFGEKGRSRVTLYNRPQKSPHVYIEWWEGNRRLARVLTVAGNPVPDEPEFWHLAKELAQKTVEKLDDSWKRDFWRSIAARPNAIPDEVKPLLAPYVTTPSEAGADAEAVTSAAAALASGTVQELFARWLAAQQTDQKQKSTAARQWTAALGADTVLKTLTPASVNEKARGLATSKRWSPKTLTHRIHHLRMALDYARNHLEWEAPNPVTIELPKLELPDTERETYSPEEYKSILTVATAVARDGPGAVVDGKVDLAVHPTADDALRVGAAAAIAGAFARRIEQVLALSVEQVTRTQILQVEALEFHFPRPTEKARRYKDAALTVATLNRVQHPLEYLIVEMLLSRRGVRTSGVLFPSVPSGKSLSDRLPSTRVKQDTMREYLRKIEKLAKVPSVSGRGFHGLKRCAVTQCATQEDLEHLTKVSNTGAATLLRYHKRLGSFVNRETRRSEEARLKAVLEQARGADE